VSTCTPTFVPPLSERAIRVHDRASEQLLEATIHLARRNEALEDYAALVAHELKNSLQAALFADDVSSALEQALELVDSLLESARDEMPEGLFASAAECFDAAVESLGAPDVEITAELATILPLPPTPLRVILRNLIANAVAAGARHVHATTSRTPGTWRLHVDDDGVGLTGTEDYAAGSGLGLSLCRRMAERFNGTLKLEPRPFGGTRATLVLEAAAQ